MDRLVRIRELLGSTARTARTDSDALWEAARLIWEERQTGRSLREIAEALGYSHMTIQYYARCWELMRKRGLVGSGSALPDFRDIYYSAEVRGAQSTRTSRRPDPADHTADGAEARGRRAPRPAADTARHRQRPADWIADANEALGRLAAHPATWPHIAPRDVSSLRAMVPQIRAILAARASQTSAAQAHKRSA